MIRKLYLFPLLFMTCSMTFALEGKGTAESPFLISTVEDLYAVNNDLTAHYKMINDIDFGDTVHTKSVIGKTTHTDLISEVFTGSFDGGGHSINNFAISIEDVEPDTVDLSQPTYVGLFSVTKGATIKNLSFDADETGQITIGFPVEERCYAGVLAGQVVGGSVENCHSSISITSYGEHVYIGGLIGQAIAMVESCSSSSSISTMGAERAVVGGISGNHDNTYGGKYLFELPPNTYFSFPAECNDCAFSGSINVFADGWTDGGGIAGEAWEVNFANCSFNGSIYSSGGDGPLGGVCGYAHIAEFINCSFDGELEIDTDGGYCGGIVGDGIHASISSCNADGSITSHALGYIGGIVGCFGGTVQDCHSHVDINAQGSCTNGFASIGGLIGAFGQAVNCSSSGNIIVKSNGDREGFVGGLFGRECSAESSNSSCSLIVESLSSEMNVGGLAGYIDPFSYVYDSYATGTVDTRGCFDSKTGGLIGELSGRANSSYSSGDVYSSGVCGGFAGEGYDMKNCFSTSDLYVIYQSSENSITNKCVGGLVGLQEGTAENCYADGDIYIDANSGESPVYVGGLFGKESIYGSTRIYSDFESINCYAKSNITLRGTDSFIYGGLLGGNYAEQYSYGGFIKNCYSDVILDYDNTNEKSVLGGFIGERQGDAVFSSCFYNLETTGVEQAVAMGYNYGIEGLFTSEFTDVNLFINAGWEFGYSDGAPWVYNPSGTPYLYYQRMISEFALSGEEGSLDKLNVVLEELGISNVFEENLVFYQEILSNSSGTFQHDVTVIQEMIDLANEGVTSCSITLNPGWNMVSCPFLNWSPAGNDIDCQLFKFYDGRYENVPAEADLTPGCGYWLFYPESEPKNVVMSGTKSTHATINISSGWNLFGPVHNEGTKAEKDVSEYSWLYGEPFYWQGHNYSSISEAESSELRLGMGYWGFVKESDIYMKSYWIDKVSFFQDNKFMIDCYLYDNYDGLKVYIWDKTANKELLDWTYFSYSSGDVIGKLTNSISAGHEYSMQIIPVNGELGGKQKKYNFALPHFPYTVDLGVDYALRFVHAEMSKNDFTLSEINYESHIPRQLEWSAVLQSSTGEIIKTASGVEDISDKVLTVSDVFEKEPLTGGKVTLSVRIREGDLRGNWKTFRFEQ